MGKAKNAGGKKLVASSAKAKGAAVVSKKSRIKAIDGAVSLKGKRAASVAARQEPVIDLTVTYERRIAELMGERERLIGEAKASGEGLESLRAELQMRSEQLADVMERLGITSQDNTVLMKLNGELQAKISEGEVSAEEARRAVGELKQEMERVVGEVAHANDALETACVESRAHIKQHRELTERLEVAMREKVTLARLNEELRAKVSGLEARAKKADRLEEELAVTRVALRQASEDLTKARELVEVKAEMPDETAPMIPGKPEEKLEPVPAVLAEVRVGTSKIRERVVPAVLAKRDVFDPTNEQFDRIRRTIVEKRNLKANMSLLDRFMLPFRDTARLVQEQENVSPE
jgi:chromosome segregation ATPase